jgi:hypothetical protein
MSTEKSRNAYKRYWRNQRNYQNHVERMEQSAADAARSHRLAEQALTEMGSTDFREKVS